MGTPREIYFQPADAFVAGFVGTTNLLAGVAETGDDRVRLAGGATIRCRLPAGMLAGQAALVAVRPETITLLDRGMTGALDANEMAGIVEQASFIGDRMRYIVRAGDLLLVVYAPPTASLLVGDSAMLAFSPEAAYAVPA